MTPNANVHPPMQQPGWFSRNWKWLVPVGCLLPVMCCGGFGAVTYFGVSKMIAGSPVFITALSKASANPDVTAALGTPLAPGFGVSGSMNETNGKGTADFSIPLEGPKGKGTMKVVARGTGGKWDFDVLEVEAGGKRIDLLGGDRVPDDAMPPDEDPPTEDAPPDDEPPAKE